MKNIFDLMHEAQDNTLENLIFYVSDIIENAEISQYKGLDTNIPENSQYLGTGRHSLDIPVGNKFEVIFAKSNMKNYQKVESSILYANVNPSVELDYLPAGYSGICLVNFPNGMPEILSNLPKYNSARSKDSDMVYLTSQKTMDRIIELLG
jgi:hypothetical protein